MQKDSHKQYSTIARIIAGVMLLLALGTWQYGFYQFLRVAVCAVSVYSAWYFFQIKHLGWTWFFAIVAVLFNPIAPIYLERGTWQLIDVVIAIVLFISLSVGGTSVETTKTTDRS